MQIGTHVLRGSAVGRLFLVVLGLGVLFGAKVAQAQPRAYVTNNNGTTVSVVNTATNTVLGTVAVGSGPFGVAVTPNGKFVYVANFNSDTVSVINTATNLVTTTVGVADIPFGVAVTPNGQFVYVANNGSDTVSVINTATNLVTATVGWATVLSLLVSSLARQVSVATAWKSPGSSVTTATP